MPDRSADLLGPCVREVLALVYRESVAIPLVKVRGRVGSLTRWVYVALDTSQHAEHIPPTFHTRLHHRSPLIRSLDDILALRVLSDGTLRLAKVTAPTLVRAEGRLTANTSHGFHLLAVRCFRSLAICWTIPPVPTGVFGSRELRVEPDLKDAHQPVDHLTLLLGQPVAGVCGCSFC